jgi:8-oxo-dGTP pyrophosphatase MutT (NUDIX family)
MNRNRPRHRVSTKAALIDKATGRVLVTILGNGKYGMPGGHVENGETPDAAIHRELKEELSIEVPSLTRDDFWKDPRGDRILLGYLGELSESQPIIVDGIEVIGTAWVSRSDITSGKVSIPSFKDYLLRVM